MHTNIHCVATLSKLQCFSCITWTQSRSTYYIIVTNTADDRVMSRGNGGGEGVRVCCSTVKRLERLVMMGDDIGSKTAGVLFLSCADVLLWQDISRSCAVSKVDVSHSVLTSVMTTYPPRLLPLVSVHPDG